MLIGREAFEGLQSPSEVIGGDKVYEVLSKLIVAIVVEALDGGVLDRPVHALDLAVRPRVSRFRQPMLNVEIGAGVLEGVSPEERVLGPQGLDLFGRPGGALGIREVRAVVGQNRMNLAGTGGRERSEEIPRDAAGRLLMQLDEDKLRSPIDGDQEVEPAFVGMDLGDVDVEIADWVATELATGWLVTLDIG